MTELPDNILHLPQYQVLGCKSTDDEMHFQVDVPDPIACEECGVQGEFVRFGKRDVPYRDLPIHGKRVTLWVVRRRYTCRACKTTFRPQLPEMVDGFRMTLRLHEYVEKESFNHPYTFVAAQTGLDEKTVRDIFNARAEFLGRWHRFETPRILGIDELYLNKRYRCILTNIEERTLLDLLATRRQDVVTNYLMKLKDRRIIAPFVDSAAQSARISVNIADVGSERMREILTDIEPKINSIVDTSKYKVSLTGTSIIFLEGLQFIIDGLFESLMLAFILIGLCMGYLFRSVKMIFFSLLPNLVPLVITAGLMGSFGVS